MKPAYPENRPPPAELIDPIFELRSVRPGRPAEPSWINLDEDDLIDEEPVVPEPRFTARRIVARVVGYALLGVLFWGTSQLAAQPQAREDILSWTTFGRTHRVHSAADRISDFVHRLRSH